MKPQIFASIGLLTLLSITLASTTQATAQSIDSPTEAAVKEVAVPSGVLGGAAMSAAGGSTAVGTAGALGIGGAVTAGAAAGVGLGIGIEHTTGLGSKAGDLLYQNSDPNVAREATDKFDAASDNWKKGNYGDAVIDGAQGVGKMFEGINW